MHLKAKAAYCFPRYARRNRQNFSHFTYFGNLQSRKIITLAITSFGIAATLLDDGQTAHLALKLSLNKQITETPTWNINKNSGMGNVLQSCQLIIWNECTMAHKKVLEALHRTLKNLRVN